MSITLPNWRLTVASTRMPGIFASSAPCAPSITESPIAVTCGGGAGWVGVVVTAPGLVGGGGRCRRVGCVEELEAGLEPGRLARREPDAGQGNDGGHDRADRDRALPHHGPVPRRRGSEPIEPAAQRPVADRLLDPAVRHLGDDEREPEPQHHVGESGDRGVVTGPGDHEDRPVPEVDAVGPFADPAHRTPAEHRGAEARCRMYGDRDRDRREQRPPPRNPPRNNTFDW